MSDRGAFLCEICGAGDIRVIRTVPALDREAVRRRRECAECGGRFWTQEYRETATCSAHQTTALGQTASEVTR